MLVFISKISTPWCWQRPLRVCMRQSMKETQPRSNSRVLVAEDERQVHHDALVPAGFSLNCSSRGQAVIWIFDFGKVRIGDTTVCPFHTDTAKRLPEVRVLLTVDVPDSQILEGQAAAPGVGCRSTCAHRSSQSLCTLHSSSSFDQTAQECC